MSKTRKIEEGELDAFLTQLGPDFDTGEMGLASITALPIHQLAQSPAQIPMPASLKIILADGIRIPLESLPPALINRLRRIASFKNPEFFKAQQMRLSTWNKARIISCADLGEDNTIILPRGCLEAVRAELFSAGISIEIEDKRITGVQFSCSFKGT